jgi:type II secretion system protein G
MEMTNRNRNILKGFTLVELLVVIAIIGILAAIGLVSFMSSQMRSRDVQRKSDLRQIGNAVELFNSDYEVYPPSSGGNIQACPYVPTSPGTSTLCVWGGESPFSDGKTPYFQKLPHDPRGVSYYYVSTGSDYKLYAKLENPEDPSGQNSYDLGTGTIYNFAITSTNTTP